MSTASLPPPDTQTLADLLDRLGGIALERIRMHPPLGTATVEDVVRIEQRENRLFELVEGVLVEKVMGHPESRVASALIAALDNYLEANDLGVVSGEGGMFRLPGNLIRIPDVAFASWERFPDDEALDDSVPEVVPDLAVEVLSQGNTPREMSRKLREYFKAGVRLVWFVDLARRSVEVYTSPSRSQTIPHSGTLEGGKVLPGFELPVAKLFARLRRSGKKRGKG